MKMLLVPIEINTKSLHMRNLYIFTIIVLITGRIFAQSSISIKAVTLAAHPFENRNSELYNTSISSNGTFTAEPGLLFSFEVFGDPFTSLKFVQMGNYDQCSKLSGYTQIMIKRKLFQYYKHSMSIGLGPMVHYREKWTDIVGYQDEGFYTDKGNMQYKITWVSGEIEYNYYIGKKGDISIALVNLHPESIGLAIGYKFWISKTGNNHKKGCISCPSFR